MKKVLITNLYLQKYTGSELHVIDIANEFSKHKYEVTIAVFSKSYPLLEYCNNFNVVLLSDPVLNNTTFDILFIQHYPTLDYLRTHYTLQYKYLIISKLSSFNGFESLPYNYEKADLISAVSKECQESISEFTNHSFLFKNSVSDSFFTQYKLKNFNLKKIAIISNHVPEEINQLKNIDSNFIYTFIGSNNNPTLVTPEVLSQYDLVITIGRTVQQCFAIGTPVYVYDHFGGPGYITKNNIQKAEDFNFSGRGFSKKTTQEILDDIIQNYSTNLEQLEYLHKYAECNFSLSKTFNHMLDLATKEEKEFQVLPTYKEPELTRIKTYSEMMPFTPYIHDEYLNTSQFYFTDEKDSINEENSLSWPITNEYIIHKKIEITSHSNFRFDPANKSCKCSILELIVDNEKIDINTLWKNSILTNKDYDYFLTTDPCYILEHPIQKYISIKYITCPLNNKDLEIINNQINVYKDYENQYNQLYKKTHPIQHVSKKFKAYHK